MTPCDWAQLTIIKLIDLDPLVNCNAAVAILHLLGAHYISTIGPTNLSNQPIILTLPFRLNETLIDIVMRDMVKKLATESLRLNDLAMKKSYDVIVKSLKVQKEFKNPEKELKHILMNLEEKHL